MEEQGSTEKKGFVGASAFEEQTEEQSTESTLQIKDITVSEAFFGGTNVVIEEEGCEVNAEPRQTTEYAEKLLCGVKTVKINHNNAKINVRAAEGKKAAWGKFLGSKDVEVKQHCCNLNIDSNSSDGQATFFDVTQASEFNSKILNSEINLTNSKGGIAAHTCGDGDISTDIRDSEVSMNWPERKAKDH